METKTDNTIYGQRLLNVNIARKGEELERGSRNIGLDFVRLIAALMVVSVHSSAEYLYHTDNGWMVVNLIDSFSRACVPLFFMVSGAVLLTKNDNASKTFDRIVKFLIPLAIWSAVYLLWFRKTGILWGYTWQTSVPRLFSLSALRHFLLGPVVFHFWFLYTLLGLYIFLPVLQSFYAKSDTMQKYIYLAAWFIGSSLLPTIIKTTETRWLGVDLSYFPLYAGYMLAGAVLLTATENRNLFLTCLIMYIASSGLTALLTSIYSNNADKTELFYTYESTTVVIAALSAFIFLCYLGYRLPPSIQSVIQNASIRLSFGIYIIHAMVLRYTIDFFDLSELKHPYFELPLIIILVFIFSGVITFAVRLLPYGSKLFP